MELFFRKAFVDSFNALEKSLKIQVKKKVLWLKDNPDFGKHLKAEPYFSLHIGKSRVIYRIEGEKIIIIDLLKRKHNYRELKRRIKK